MNNYPTKFCVNCTNFDLRNQICGEARSIRHVAPVSGKTLYEQAIVMRSDPSMCGMDATWFTEKPKDTRNLWRRLHDKIQ